MGILLRRCSEKVKVEGDKDPALFFVYVGQFVWNVSLLHSNAVSKVVRHLKHSPADSCELSFVQIPVKQVSDLNQPQPSTEELGSLFGKVSSLSKCIYIEPCSLCTNSASPCFCLLVGCLKEAIHMY